MTKYIALVLLIVGLAWVTVAQTPGKDSAAYCLYATEQAKAQADFLRSPSFVTGLTQPATGTPAQAYTGVAESIKNLKKVGVTLAAARAQCELYASTNDTQAHILFAIPTLERAALLHRAEVVSDVEARMNDLIAENQKRVDAQDMTIATIYTLRSNIGRLEMDKASDNTEAAAIYIPPMLDDASLKVLLTDKQNEEVKNQDVLNRLSRLNNWDLTVEGGVRHQISPISFSNTDAGGYATFVFTYSLGSKKIDKHLDRAADAYDELKKAQMSDTTQQAAALLVQITNSIAALEQKRAALQSQESVIASNLKLVENADTSAALAFNLQLQGDALLLRVEVEDAEFRLAALKSYLTYNF